MNIIMVKKFLSIIALTLCVGCDKPVDRTTLTINGIPHKLLGVTQIGDSRYLVYVPMTNNVIDVEIHK